MDSAESNISPTVEPLFRQLSGQLTATLTRILGTAEIDTAEAIVQEAFLKACEIWPIKGIPANPAGWITTVAKNLAIDSIRRRKRIESLSPAIAEHFEKQLSERFSDYDKNRLRFIDDQLQMMLLACHPILSRRSQVMLTLRLAGGFSIGEISKAFLSNEESVRKVITRSKQSLREVDDPMTWPDETQLDLRIEAVLEVLYSVFNEGYSLGDEKIAIRADLCDEAIRLTKLLRMGSRDFPSEHSISALLSLMLLHSSRIPARIDASDSLVLLPDQDRTKWNSARISEGLKYLRESIGGNKVSVYHLEAQIAGTHAVAKDYESTNWPFVAELYNRLYDMTGNPVIGLNRAVAISEAHGIDAGLTAIDDLEIEDKLANYYLYYAALADLHRRAGNGTLALKNYHSALALVSNELERALIKKRIDETAGV